MKAYREWLPADGYEGGGSIGGSFVSGDIEDYYLTPYELGYGPFVKFDHDFIGREALEKIAGEPHRKKVTFAWNADDVARVFRSFFEPGIETYKYHRHPEQPTTPRRTTTRCSEDGRTVGLSMFAGYSYNERSYLSLGVVDPDVQVGDVLTLVWGEENGGTQEDHGRAAQADRDPRQGLAGALFARRPGELCRGLAHPAARLTRAPAIAWLGTPRVVPRFGFIRAVREFGRRARRDHSLRRRALAR